MMGHKITTTYIARENGNDCDQEKIECTCGLHSWAQEGGGVWQYGKDERIAHNLDETHARLVTGDPNSQAGKYVPKSWNY